MARNEGRVGSALADVLVGLGHDGSSSLRLPDAGPVLGGRVQMVRVPRTPRSLDLVKASVAVRRRSKHVPILARTNKPASERERHRDREFFVFFFFF